MPWKEPGEKPREPNDTWGSGDRQGDGDRSGERQNNRPGGRRPPPGGGNDFDLEAQLRKLRQRFGRFGGGPSGLIALIVAAILVWFAVGSWTLVDAREAGILLRLGQYQATLQPGLHFHLPRPFATVLKVDVGRSRTVSDQIRMLTSDGQIALVDFFVQYKVADPRKFLFAVRDPEDAMRQATLAVLRAQVGTQTMQQLGAQTGKALTDRIKADLQKRLDGYGSGVEVTEVGIQNVTVPQEVKDAWNDIGNARQDAQRVEGDAHAAAAKAEADAHAQASQMQADADAYKTGRIAAAQGEASRFDQILSAYRAAPDVTRRKLWLQTMQEVLARNRTVINAGGGNVIIQMPPPAGPHDKADTSVPAPPASSGAAARTPEPAHKAKGGAA
ncbi:MAG TPA: FtsH protease activity modulator HflK [Rhodanobacteraceae bacterium]|jgi:membrane protease subunit HflK|nr:FtsH protease activity modulator HflK [Rhodanobacteraceae bacterium]